MGAFIGDKSLMAIVGFMRDACLTHDEIDALEECVRGLEGSAKPSESSHEQAAKNKPAIDLLTEWIQRTPTPEEEEAWDAFAKLVEESEPDETPEDAATDYVNQVHQLDRDGYTAEDVRSNARAAYLAGYRDALAVPKSVQELRKEHGIGERPEHRDEIDAGKRCASDICVETPEEAAERWASEFWDEEGNEYNDLMRACGVSGWLAALRWAKQNPKAVEGWAG
jgi:hypothetical protein